MTKKNLFIILCLFFYLTSCKKKCEDSRDNIIKVQFYNKTSLERDTLAFVSVKGIGLGIDSILYTQKDTLHTFFLPASTISNEIEFNFARKEGAIIKNYLIRFNYQKRIQIITPECGITEDIFDLKVPFSDFDSVQVVSPKLENNNNANIHIYN